MFCFILELSSFRLPTAHCHSLVGMRTRQREAVLAERPLCALLGGGRGASIREPSLSCWTTPTAHASLFLLTTTSSPYATMQQIGHLLSSLQGLQKTEEPCSRLTSVLYRLLYKGTLGVTDIFRPSGAFLPTLLSKQWSP